MGFQPHNAEPFSIICACLSKKDCIGNGPRDEANVLML